MRKRAFNIVEFYLFAKEWGMSAAAAKYGITEQYTSTIVSICNAVYEEISKDGKNALAGFTTKQLMRELANRGYRGTLTYAADVDIEKF